MGRKVVLCIMDGFGIRDEVVYGNAIKQAHTPNLDYLKREYPNILLEASGEQVGLPEGQMGNSEVGHMNIGAGRVVYQSLSLINKKIKDGSFFENEKLLKAIKHVNDNNSTLHIFSLLSDGGVHSHINHLLAMMDMAKKENVQNLYLHMFLDGRDVSPQSSSKYFEVVENKIKELNLGVIASISGRYYAMDRDKNYDRVYKSYQTMVDLKGNSFDSPIEDVESEYLRLKQDGWDSSDEFVMPAYNKCLKSGIRDNDSIIFMNIRPDRAIEISTMITNTKEVADLLMSELRYEKREIAKVIMLNNKNIIMRIIDVAYWGTNFENICYVCMMKYSESVKGDIAFKLDELNNILGEYLANNNYKQLRIAETEKYAHVTFFFDGTKNYDGVEREQLKNSCIGMSIIFPIMVVIRNRFR